MRFKSGKENPMYGKGEVRKGKNNPNWKGDKVGYVGLHLWVKRRKPKPKFCQCCQTKAPIDLAVINNKYTRNLSDWWWVCRTCHMLKDGRMNNLWKGIPVGKKHPRLGKHFSEESKEKIRQKAFQRWAFLRSV